MPTAFPIIYPIKLRSGALTQGPAERSIYAGRLFSRRAVDVRARLLARRQVNGHMEEAVVYGRTVDVSCSGAGLTLTCELPAGSEVLLSLQLSNSDGPLCHPSKPTTGSPGTPLCLRAVVVRRRGCRAGLKFVQPTAEQRLVLLEFCYA